MSRAVTFWLAIMFAFSGAMLIFAARKFSTREKVVPRTTVTTSPSDELPTGVLLKEYSLRDQNGEEFGTKELLGSVHVVNFFFATCPSTCRVENQKVQAIDIDFGEKGVKFVSITCDPEKDTSAALLEYSKLFNAKPESWRFLTGELLYIRRIGSDIYQAPVNRQTHTEKLFVVDKWGNLRGRFRWDKADEMSKMREMLTRLLAETTAPENPRIETDPPPRPPQSDEDDAEPSAEKAS